jgi:FkbM family methyltransferase
VFAFEPSPFAYEGLCAHVRLNDVGDRVTAVRSAVSAHIGAVPFLVESTAGEGRLGPARSSRATLLVRSTTIDAFCEREDITPDFIKVDVEGAELEVLRGARETIARTAGRLALFVELHPSLWPERGLSRDDVAREIARLGLRVVSPVPDADPFTVEGVAARLIAR